MVCIFVIYFFLIHFTLRSIYRISGFPLAAVACIVRGVESLHICFDYLHEAMALPSIEKKLFVLELTSCLCVKFRIARTLVVARLAVDVIGTILISYPLNARYQIMTVGSRCLARIGNVFPPLREECLAILDQMRAMDRSGQRTSRQWKCTAGHLLGGTSLTSNPVALSSLLDSAVASVSGHPALLSQND
jgi:integrator complex subunit 2